MRTPPIPPLSPPKPVCGEMYVANGQHYCCNELEGHAPGNHRVRTPDGRIVLEWEVEPLERLRSTTAGPSHTR